MEEWEELEQQVFQTRSENAALKNKLHEVSRALTQATRAMQKEVSGHKTHGLDRELQQKYKAIAEIREENRRLHEKTDSDVLSSRQTQLQLETKAKDEEIRAYRQENKDIGAMIKRIERQVRHKHEGKGDGDAFARDYEYILNENSKARGKIGDLQAEIEKVEATDAAQITRIRVMQAEVRKTGKDTGMIKQLNLEREETKQLVAVQEKLRKKLEITQNSRVSTYNLHMRRQREHRAEIAALTKDILSLAERHGEDPQELLAKIPAAERMAAPDFEQDFAEEVEEEEGLDGGGAADVSLLQADGPATEVPDGVDDWLEGAGGTAGGGEGGARDGGGVDALPAAGAAGTVDEELNPGGGGGSGGGGQEVRAAQSVQSSGQTYRAERTMVAAHKAAVYKRKPGGGVATPRVAVGAS
eukprot:SAG22_NODE_638_length_8262_cov_4.658826_1_plen_414_part_00